MFWNFACLIVFFKTKSTCILKTWDFFISQTREVSDEGLQQGKILNTP